MAALQPKQFGDYTLRQEPSRQLDAPYSVVRAYHPDQAKHAGELLYYHRDLYSHTRGEIAMVQVADEHQRRGVATALHDYAKQDVPELGHSERRSDAGDAWARKIGGPLPKRRP